MLGDARDGTEGTAGLIRRRVVVSGLVQGVWFRESCRHEADEQGVVGWVRNLPDGQVEAAFEGPADAVAAMVAWAHRGPRRARVDHVEVLDEAPRGDLGFRVGRTLPAP
jgi:acylphosphatase